MACYCNMAMAHMLAMLRCCAIKSCHPGLKRFPFYENQKHPHFLSALLSGMTQVGEVGHRELTSGKTLGPVSFTSTQKQWEQSQTPLRRCDSRGRGGASLSLSTELAGDIQGHKRQLEKVSGNTLSDSRPPVPRKLGHRGFLSTPGGQLISQFTQSR